MKKAILIYNQNAGGLGKIKLQELMQQLKLSNIDAVYQVTEGESDLDEILLDPPELVIAAGGDGTIRGVAKRIIDTDTTLGIIPIGTANNFARSLGLTSSTTDILQELADYEVVNIDVGKVFAPWGETIFLEGVGFGFFADLLEKYRPVTEKRIGRALGVFFEGITEIHPYKSEFVIDGQNITGNYLLVEILNSQSIGPRLRLASESDIKDGYLDVVRIGRTENIISVALNLITDNLDSLKGVYKSKAKEISFIWNGFPLHIDEEVYPDVNEKINYWYATNAEGIKENEKKESREIIVRILEKKLKVLLPIKNEKRKKTNKAF